MPPRARWPRRGAPRPRRTPPVAAAGRRGSTRPPCAPVVKGGRVRRGWVRQGGVRRRRGARGFASHGG
eukprot:scaffold40889_cov48-Phaeocystis_antarctica.AAC.1